MEGTRNVMTPREAREQFEAQVSRQMVGLFRAFELYMRGKYGLETVEDQSVGLSLEERARRMTDRFNRSLGETQAPPASSSS